MLNAIRAKYRAIILLILGNVFFTNISCAQSSSVEPLVRPTTLNKLLINQGVGVGISSGAISAIDYLDNKWQVESILGHLTKSIMRLTIARTIATTNHELFGHGSRALEANSAITEIFIALPFSNSHSYTHSLLPKHLHQHVLIDLGGNEVNYLLGESLKDGMIANNYISPFKGISYYLSQGNQLNYNIYTFLFNNDAKHYSRDIYNYSSRLLRTMEFAPTAQHIAMTDFLARIKNLMIIDLLDPFLYYSLYSFATGKVIEVPMLSIAQDLEYLPAARLLMTPYGLEIKFVNNFSTPKHTANLNFSYGNNFDLKSYSVQGVFYNIARHSLGTIDAEISVWSQPDFINAQLLKPLNGALGKLTFNYNLTSKFQISISGGYKSAGYQPGYGVEAGILFGLGGGIKF